MPVYSHSRIEAFETCPLKFKFRYIEKIETPIEETVEAFVGSLVHETLEKLYNDLHYEKLDPLDELLSFYHAAWQKQWNPGIKIARLDLTEQNYFDYGAKCVRNYYERYRPFDQSQTLATELQLHFSLGDGEGYKLTGFVDRAARRADGTYEIHDYKTGRTLPSQQKLDQDRQLALYQIGIRQRWPEAERVDLLWHYVGHDTTLRSTRTPDQLEALRASTIAQIQGMEAEKDFPPHKGDHCEWCEYQPVCPLWKHVVAVQALPPAQFAADEGVRLANEFAETKRQKSLLEQREEQLRELIIEFCRQKDVKVLQGAGARVNVRFMQRTKFPGKNDSDRAQLDDFVRTAGKWDEVSELDTYALARTLHEESWPRDLLGQLRQFATQDESVTVALKRQKEREE